MDNALDTPMTNDINIIRAAFSEQKYALTRDTVKLDEYKAPMAKDIPLGRFGRAEEFANIACFLASDQGSYITGTAINVDGGRSPVV